MFFSSKSNVFSCSLTPYMLGNQIMTFGEDRFRRLQVFHASSAMDYSRAALMAASSRNWLVWWRQRVERRKTQPTTKGNLEPLPASWMNQRFPKKIGCYLSFSHCYIYGYFLTWLRKKGASSTLHVLMLIAKPSSEILPFFQEYVLLSVFLLVGLAGIPW